MPNFFERNAKPSQVGVISGIIGFILGAGAAAVTGSNIFVCAIILGGISAASGATSAYCRSAREENSQDIEANVQAAQMSR